MKYFRLRVRRTKSAGDEQRFVIETMEIENPATMALGESEPLTESELRAKLAKLGLTPQEVESEINRAAE